MKQGKVGNFEWALLGALVGLTALSLVLAIWQASVMQPIRLPAIMIDRLNTTIGLLVAGIGTVAFRFSLRYLDGEPGQRQFLGWLCFTIIMAYLLILSSNLLLLMAAWAGTSLGLHHLLTFYQDRRQAQRLARKKFLISRLGDLALLSAISLIGWQWGTLDLPVFLEQVNSPTSWAGAPTAVAFLIALAAIAKSAQFPFYSWLPETMEAPTPVSALMHAGIINAGGVLILRFAPLMISAPVVLLLLTLIGTLTALIGSITLWTQIDVKRSLAWSTVSQMGFMMIQCGLAVFPAAILHIVGHGCYKAWSFLRSGGLPEDIPIPAPLGPRAVLIGSGLGSLVAIPAVALASWFSGFNPLHTPGELALSALLALSLGQLWVTLMRSTVQISISRTFLALLALLAAALLACSLYESAALFYAPVFGQLTVANSPLTWVAAGVPILAFVGLVGLYALLPILGGSAAGRTLYIYAVNGFYLGTYANRLVERVWRSAAH